MPDRLERYRTELRSLHYIRLCAEETEQLAAIYRSPQFRTMAGFAKHPELSALFEMFVSKRVPPDISQSFVQRFVMETIIDRSRAGAPAADH